MRLKLKFYKNAIRYFSINFRIIFVAEINDYGGCDIKPEYEEIYHVRSYKIKFTCANRDTTKLSPAGCGVGSGLKCEVEQGE